MLKILENKVNKFFERDDLATPFLARFRAKKNADCTNYNILLPATGWHLIPFHHPQRVYGRTEYADVTTKFSRMDSLPHFLNHGAPMVRASRARAPLLNNGCIPFSQSKYGFCDRKFDCLLH